MGVSTVSTNLYTTQLTDATMWKHGAEGGRLRVILVPYVSTAIEAGSTINVCKIPKGAKVIGVEAHAEANAASSTLALKVGSVTVGAAASIAAAAIVTSNVNALAAAAVEAATAITAVTAGATLTAEKKITFIVQYVAD